MPVRTAPPTLTPSAPQRPEILAPAGDRESLRVALACGADAVYFGLDSGFNARARARNMPLDDLPDIVAEVHRAGARAYVVVNTLIFESELDDVAHHLHACAAAGVDALIIQDPATCLLARAICPHIEIHASTQMTISSAESARFAKTLGVTRIVVPRELSTNEIRHVREHCDLELEVFIHGALCMSWSGQCLTSEAWGGRSANRGQCAQSCRMPYELIVDGTPQPTEDLRYLLSPLDLAGHRAVPALMEIGVHTLKIEGRLKGPAYVETSVRSLRRWVDAIMAGEAHRPEPQARLAEDLRDATLAYSRGFSDGFLAGSDHQNLVPGRFPRSRGYQLGVVRSVRGDTVTIERTDADGWTGPAASAPRGAPRPPATGDVSSPLPALGGDQNAATGARVARLDVQPGMGVAFDHGRPEQTDEPGGPIFAVEAPDETTLLLRFGRPGPDLRRVRPGALIWVTSDPRLHREALRAAATPPTGRVPVTLRVAGRAGTPLTATLTATLPTGQLEASGATSALLEPSSGGGIDDDLLRNKLAGFGNTPLRLETLDRGALDDGLHLPVSALKQLRRSLVDQLVPLVERGGRPAPRRADEALAAVRAAGAARLPLTLAATAHADHAPQAPTTTPPLLLPLVRTDEQLDAVIAHGLPEVELDWMEMTGLGRAVARARDAGLRVTIATTRVQKPGEEGFDRRIERLEPDAVLVRHWAGLMHFNEHRSEGLGIHGDFSLNVTNSITAAHLLGLGLDTFTAAHDLNAPQLFALLDRVPADRATVVIHQHMSTFHTEHCVYAATLSSGRDYRTCGRPCEAHRVALRDHLGNDHPVLVDVGCRNTVFNAQAQSAPSLVPALLARGVRRFRAEFVWERRDETSRTLTALTDLLAGRLSPERVLETLRVHEQFGVTMGTMMANRATD